MTGPVVPPGGEELRDAIDRALFRSGAANYDLAPDLILALPAVRDALAAQETLRWVLVWLESGFTAQAKAALRRALGDS